MSTVERQDLLDSNQVVDDGVDMDEGEDDAFMHPPPGAEGANHSHAGDEEMVSQLGETMHQHRTW